MSHREHLIEAIVFLTVVALLLFTGCAAPHHPPLFCMDAVLRIEGAKVAGTSCFDIRDIMGGEWKDKILEDLKKEEGSQGVDGERS